MKKILILSIFTALLCAQGFTAGDATQNEQGNASGYGGFTGPRAANINTVAAALKAWDDTMVTLTGRIVRQVAHEKYEFTDNTGSIIVEIDDDKWYGLSVSPNDTVQIYGEVDSETFRKNEVDVKMIKKVN